MSARLIIACAIFAASASLADREQAQRLFEEGTAAYNLGQFDEAARLYEAAYESERLPQLLFNIAQAHFGAKAYERSIFFYEAFLRELPDTEERASVEARIGEAQLLQQKAQLEAQQRAEAERVAQERARAEAEARRAEAEAKRAEEERLGKEAEEIPPVYDQAWFWPTVGGTAGGIAIVTGVVIATWLIAVPPDTLPPFDLQ